MAYVRKADRQAQQRTVQSTLAALPEPDQQYAEKMRQLYKSIELLGAPRRTSLGNYQALLDLGQANKVEYPALVNALNALIWDRSTPDDIRIEAEHILAAHGWTQVGGGYR